MGWPSLYHLIVAGQSQLLQGVLNLGVGVGHQNAHQVTLGVHVHQYGEGDLVQAAHHVDDPVAEGVILGASEVLRDLLQFVQLLFLVGDQLVQCAL